MRRKTFNRVVRASKILAAVFLVSLLAYLYFWTNAFVVTSFSFEGVPKEQVTALETSLNETFEGKTAFIFPKNRILSFPRSDMVIRIRKILPNSDSVTIHPYNFHTLLVSVVPYSPIFRMDDGKAMDPRGIIYREQNDISNLPLLKLATTARDGAFLSNLSIFVQKVTTVVFPVGTIEINALRDVYIYPKAGSSTLILAGDTDLKKGWSTLVSALDTNPLKSMLEDTTRKLEYIDLRFGNKVFYKFTNQAPLGIITPHASSTQTDLPR